MREPVEIDAARKQLLKEAISQGGGGTPLPSQRPEGSRNSTGTEALPN